MLCIFWTEATGKMNGLGGCEGDVTVFCEHKDKEMVHMFTLKDEATLLDVYEVLNEKWDDICIRTTKLHYEEPDGGYNVEVSNDGDLEIMRRVHKMVGRAFCRMVATSIPVPKKRMRLVMRTDIQWC